MYSVVIKHRAMLMINEAYEWYQHQRDGLGDELLQEMNGYFKKLEAAPLNYGKIRKDYRQMRLKRFPYVIIYEVLEQQVVVFAVFHTSRNQTF